MVMGIKGNVPEKFDRMMDPLFKYYFTRPGNEDLLLSLINALLSTDTGLRYLKLAKGEEPFKTKFKSAKVLAVASTPEIDGGKGLQLDVLAKAEDDTEVYIEIKNCKQAYIEDRAEICSERLVAKYNSKEDLEKGIRKPVVSIWLLDGELMYRRKSDKVICPNVKVDPRNGEVVSTLKSLYVVQMPKEKPFNYHEARLNGVLTLEAEAWIRFLLGDGPDEGWDAMDEMSPEIGQKLRQLEKDFWADKEQCSAYEAANDTDLGWGMNYEYAFSKGLEGGMKKGMEKGDEEGAERITFEVVQRMIGKELPDDFILEMANITPKQLQEYKNEYKLDHPEA